MPDMTAGPTADNTTKSAIAKLASLDFSAFDKRWSKSDFTADELANYNLTAQSQANISKKSAIFMALILVPLGIYELYSLASYLFAIATGSREADDVTALIIYFVLFAIFLDTIRIAIRPDKRAKDKALAYQLQLAAFARDNGLVLQPDRALTDEQLPTIMQLGTKNRRLIDTLAFGDKLQFGTFYYQYTESGSGDSIETVTVELPYIHLIMTKGTANDIAITTGIASGRLTSGLGRPKGKIPIKLEGDFNKSYSVYSNIDNSEVWRVLAPDIMAKMLDCPFYDYEVINTHLFVLCQLGSSHNGRQMINDTLPIIKELEEQLD